MDAQQGSGVAKDAAEQTTVTALPLNPLAKEFTPAVGGATTPALNTLAKEFVPVALNPLAKEFVPRWGGRRDLSADAPEFLVAPPAGIYFQAPTAVVYPADGFYDLGNAIAVPPRTWRTRGNNYSQHGRARFSQRVQRIHKREFVRKTIYITNIDHTVTEEMLAELFGSCGIVVDCRLCGDPSSGFRFAFLEFPFEEDAVNALHLDGAIIGLCPLKVAPSRTAIMPIKYSLLPQSEEELEMSSRTVYCTNIEKTITPAGLKNFCETYFGLVSRLRLLGHESHATQIAFIEFVEASGAIVALSSSGIYADGLPIRVSPSKTPIRGGDFDKPPRHDNEPAGDSLN
uniref:Uncharacterized protein n=1 Tax=Avena sativa TaxID=4498 RepID=A0ACD5Y3E5_AVESA